MGLRLVHGGILHMVRRFEDILQRVQEYNPEADLNLLPVLKLMKQLLRETTCCWLAFTMEIRVSVYRSPSTARGFTMMRSPCPTLRLARPRREHNEQSKGVAQ